MTPDAVNQSANREQALAAIRHDVAERIRSVCATWPEDETERLVERIAEVKYKYECLLDCDIWSAATISDREVT